MIKKTLLTIMYYLVILIPLLKGCKKPQISSHKNILGSWNTSCMTSRQLQQLKQTVVYTYNIYKNKFQKTKDVFLGKNCQKKVFTRIKKGLLSFTETNVENISILKTTTASYSVIFWDKTYLDLYNQSTCKTYKLNEPIIIKNNLGDKYISYYTKENNLYFSYPWNIKAKKYPDYLTLKKILKFNP